MQADEGMNPGPPARVLEALERAKSTVNSTKANCPACNLNFGTPPRVGAESRMVAHWAQDHMVPGNPPENPAALVLEVLAVGTQRLREGIGDGCPVCQTCGTKTAEANSVNRDDSLTRHWAECHHEPGGTG